MKEWPEDNEPLRDVEDIVEDIREVIDFAYDLKRKNEDKDIPYDGYPHFNKATTPPIKEMLSVESLEYDENHQGRDPMTMILWALFMLAAEQGKRIEREKMEPEIRLRVTEEMLAFFKKEKETNKAENESIDEL